MTMTAQLPVADYVELKGILEAMAATIGGPESELGHDERMGLALLSLARRGPSEGGGGAPGRILVAHVGLVALLEHHRRLRAELERAGLISAEVLERLACDADVIVALDDEAGHTMYEGRAQRFPSDTQRRELWRRDRHCRFPGCSHATYTNVHHIEAWTPSGRTDLDNLVTLCRHHHHEIHSQTLVHARRRQRRAHLRRGQRHHHDLETLAAVAQRRRHRMRRRWSEHTATGVQIERTGRADTALAAPGRYAGTTTGGSGDHASVRRPPRRQRRLEPKRNDDISSNNPSATMTHPNPSTPLSGAVHQHIEERGVRQEQDPRNPSQPEWNAIVKRSVKIQSKKMTKRGEMAAMSARMHPTAQRGRPPVAAAVDPVSL